MDKTTEHLITFAAIAIIFHHWGWLGFSLAIIFSLVATPTFIKALSEAVDEVKSEARNDDPK